MIALCLTGTLSACPKGEDDKTDGGTRADAGQKDSGTSTPKDTGTDEPVDDAGTGKVDAGKTDAGGGTDAGGTTDSGTKTDAAADAKVDAMMTKGGNAPALESALARQSGRFGADLRIDVTGTDTDGDVVAVIVSLFTKANEPIKLDDTNGDGKPDATSKTLSLNAAVGTGAAASSYAVIPNMFAANQGIDHVEVTLLDATSLQSAPLTVATTTQPVLAASAQCDANYVENRCGDGYGCKGTVPTTCQAGEAPKVSRVSYLSDDLGTRVLIEGTDADTDVKSYKVEFLSASSSPVLLDLDNDEVPESSSLERDFQGNWDGNKFFLRLDQGDVFAEMVAKVRVTMTDRGNQSSAPVVADKAVTPTRTSGQTCDPRSFDRCATNTVCVSANMGKTYSCTPASTARTRACTAALVLEPAKGVTTVRGNVAAPSLWDAPAGCSLGDSANQNEALVKLVLAAPAAKVTLSTNNAFTAFDSTVYAIAKCEDTPTLAWCADDSLDKKSGAELVLTNLAAGSYFVIVDSFAVDVAGSTWQLDVKVE